MVLEVFGFVKLRALDEVNQFAAAPSIDTQSNSRYGWYISLPEKPHVQFPRVISYKASSTDVPAHCHLARSHTQLKIDII